MKTFENSQWKVINLILDDDEKYQPIVYLKPDQQASKSTKSTMSNNGEECTHENEHIPNEPEVQPLDEPEVPTNAQTPVPSQCTKVTKDLDALSIDLDKNVIVISETQLSQIPPKNNAESNSDTNINITREESSSIEDSFIRGIFSTSTRLDDGVSAASRQDDTLPSVQSSQDFTIGPGKYFSMKTFAKMVPEVVDIYLQI